MIVPFFSPEKHTYFHFLVPLALSRFIGCLPFYRFLPYLRLHHVCHHIVYRTATMAFFVKFSSRPPFCFASTTWAFPLYFPTEGDITQHFSDTMLAAILYGIRHVGFPHRFSLPWRRPFSALRNNSNDVLFSVRCGEETARGVLTPCLHRQAKVIVN